MDIQLLIELDGLPAKEVAKQCGYDVEEIGAFELERFHEDIATVASSYLKAISEARKRGEGACAREGLGCSSPHLIPKLEGAELYDYVHRNFAGLDIGPPWSGKDGVVQSCGYAYLDEEGNIKLSRDEFFEAFITAEEGQVHGPPPRNAPINEKGQETESMHDKLTWGGSDEEIGVEGVNAGVVFEANGEFCRRVSVRSSDEVDKAIISLMKLCQSLTSRNGSCTTVKAVRIKYSGGGDDGEIESVEYLCTSPDEYHVSFACPPEISCEGENLSRELFEDKIKDLAFSITCNTHGSWFNEMGGGGYLLVDLESETIMGKHIQDANPDEEWDDCFRRGYISPYFFEIFS